MKKIMLSFAIMFIAVFTYSQTNKEEVDLFQAAFGMEKKALVADNIKLDAAQKDAFWALYDEYEAERKDLGKKRIDLYEQYVNGHGNMTGEQIDAWMKEIMDLQGTTDKLIKTYYGKIKKVTSPVVAAQFYQIETFILTAIRMELQKEMPLVKAKN